jgi:hypothetical protein
VVILGSGSRTLQGPEEMNINQQIVWLTCCPSMGVDLWTHGLKSCL